MARNNAPPEDQRKSFVFLRFTKSEREEIELARGEEPAAAFARRVALEKARGQ